MADQREIIYGKHSNPSWMGQCIEVFMNNDGHLGINCTNNGHIDVFHYMIKSATYFETLIEEFKKIVSESNDINTAIDNIEEYCNICCEADLFLAEYPDYEEPGMRSEEEICKYMDEAFDRVWLVRKQNLYCNLLTGQETIQLDIMDSMIKAIDKACDKWGINFKEAVSDWDYGYWSGILAALRWVMGDEKDFLDT